MKLLFGISMPVSGFGLGAATGGGVGGAGLIGTGLAKLKGLFAGGGAAASQSAAIAAGMDVGAMGAGGGGAGIGGFATAAAPFAAQFAAMEILSQLSGGPSFTGALFSPQPSYMPTFQAGTPEYEAQQNYLAQLKADPLFGAPGHQVTVHIENVVADDPVKFVSEMSELADQSRTGTQYERRDLSRAGIDI